MEDPYAINVYTDGSMLSGPRRGGAGIVIILPESHGGLVMKQLSDSYVGATNQQMEIRACILALKHARAIESLKEIGRVRLHTDSMYVVDNFPRARDRWSRNNWRRPSGAPVNNAELWKELVAATRLLGVRVDICWIKGHKNSEWNKEADKLAKKAAASPFKQRVPGIARRKTSRAITKAGSITPSNQRVRIRVISGEAFRLQREHRYRIEVISKGNPMFGAIDHVFSATAMRAGHKYMVKLNGDPNYPMIVRIFEDLTLKERLREVASSPSPVPQP